MSTHNDTFVVSLSVREIRIGSFIRLGLVIEVNEELANRFRATPHVVLEDTSGFLVDGSVDAVVNRRVHYINPRVVFKDHGEFYKFFDLPDEHQFHPRCIDFCDQCPGFLNFCKWASENPEKFREGIQKATTFAYSKLISIIQAWETISRIQGVVGGDENNFTPVPKPKVQEFMNHLVEALSNPTDIELRIGKRAFKIQILESKDYQPLVEEYEKKLHRTMGFLTCIMEKRFTEELEMLEKTIEELRKKVIRMPTMHFLCIKEGMQVYYDYNNHYYCYIFPISFKFEYVYRRGRQYRIAKKHQKRFKGFLVFKVVPEGAKYKVVGVELWDKKYEPFYGPHSNPEVCLGDFAYILNKRFTDPVELIEYKDILEQSFRYINMDSMYGSWSSPYDTLRKMLEADFDAVTELPEEERRREEFTTEEEYEVPPEEEEYPEEEEEDWEEY